MDDIAMANLLNKNVVDYPYTTGKNSVSRTPPRVTPLVPKYIFFHFKPVELHSIEMVDVLRANFQRSHGARMKQPKGGGPRTWRTAKRALSFTFSRCTEIVKAPILHLDASLLLVSVFNVLFWVPAIRTVLMHR